MVPSPVQTVVAFLRARVHLMLTKAPKEAPVALIVVFVLALLVLALYVVATKIDTGTIFIL